MHIGMIDDWYSKSDSIEILSPNGIWALGPLSVERGDLIFSIGDDGNHLPRAPDAASAGESAL